MHRRTLLAAAWLTAALAALGVGVVAVNLVGASIVGPPGGVRDRSGIERDLAAAPLDPPPSAAATGGPSSRPPPAPTDDVEPPTRPPSSPTAGTPVRREFRVAGGLVVAECAGGLARLLSWSPGPDYRIDEADPGPDDDASVQFDGPDTDVELTVTCDGGAPVGRVEEDD